MAICGLLSVGFALTGLLTGWPTRLFTDEVRRAVQDAYIASLEPYRRGDGFEVEAEFVYGTARRA
jgi:hypothetical protein